MLTWLTWAYPPAQCRNTKCFRVARYRERVPVADQKAVDWMKYHKTTEHASEDHARRTGCPARRPRSRSNRNNKEELTVAFHLQDCHKKGPEELFNHLTPCNLHRVGINKWAKGHLTA